MEDILLLFSHSAKINHSEIYNFVGFWLDTKMTTHWNFPGFCYLSTVLLIFIISQFIYLIIIGFTEKTTILKF